MASTIITKNSSTASATPAVGDLQQGELAVNVTDKKVYTKDSSAAIVKLVGSLGNQEASAVAITGGSIAGITDLAVADGGTGSSTAAGARSNLGAAASGANSDITSLSGLTTALSVAQGGTGVTTSTGTGSVVLSNSPTLVTPALGTPSAAVLTNATGLPLSTGISGLGTGVATFLGTPSSANLLAAVTDETGTGALVFANSPTLVTPALGTPASATLTNATGLPISTGVSGLGTGVATALAVNVGSAGAPVVNGGVLGTPSSGTLTNATGLPISTGVSGLGTGVATALAVNVGSAGAPVVNGGALGTPSSGTATNLTGLPLTTGVTGTLPTANGGTNLTSFTSGGVVYASSTSALTTGSLLTFDGSRLGIGTSSPSTYGKLAVVGGNGTGSTIIASYGGTSAGDYGLLVLGTGTTAKASMNVDSSNNNVRFDTRGNTGDFYWASGASYTEGMRLTSTGLGIGTSSPAQKLHVAGVARIAGATNGANGDLQLWSVNSAGSGYCPATISNVSTGSSSSALTFSTASSGTATEVARLDSSGNLGLGVTPSAWGSSFRALQVTNASALWSASNGDLQLANNAYYDGSNYRFVYGSGSAYAAQYQQKDGKHAWYTAASGTAGNAISFTQAMTLDASGDFQLGTTSSTFSNKMTIVGGPGGDAYLTVGDGTRTGYMGSNGTVINIGSYSNTPITFNVNDTERARIDSSGRLLVGLTSANTSGSNFQVSSGVTFPATQSASSDANTLDDYEEGTFTPTAFGATTTGTTSYSTQSGSYTKIGRQVTVVVATYWTAMTGTGNLRIGNLPFTSSVICAGSILIDDLNWDGGSQITPLLVNGESEIRIYYCGDNIATAQQQCVNESAGIRITLTYFV